MLKSDGLSLWNQPMPNFDDRVSILLDTSSIDGCSVDYIHHNQLSIECFTSNDQSVLTPRNYYTKVVLSLLYVTSFNSFHYFYPLLKRTVYQDIITNAIVLPRIVSPICLLI